MIKSKTSWNKFIFESIVYSSSNYLETIELELLLFRWWGPYFHWWNQCNLKRECNNRVYQLRILEPSQNCRSRLDWKCHRLEWNSTDHQSRPRYKYLNLSIRKTVVKMNIKNFTLHDPLPPVESQQRVASVTISGKLCLQTSFEIPGMVTLRITGVILDEANE